MKERRFKSFLFICAILVVVLVNVPLQATCTVSKICCPTQTPSAEKESATETIADTCQPIEDCCLRGFPMGGYLFSGFSGSRQRSDSVADPLFGAVAGINLGFPLINSIGVGVQAGASFSYYNWGGAFNFDNNGSHSYAQREASVTVGLFKERYDCSLWSAALVYDMLFGSDFSHYAFSVNLFQLRAEVNIPIWGRTEASLWGTYGLKNSKLYINDQADFPLMFQPLSQICLGLRHHFKRGGQARLYGGIPYGTAPYNATATLDPHYSAPLSKYNSTRYILGFNANAPLNCRWSVYTNAVYTKGTNAQNPNNPNPKAWSNTFAVCCGFSFNFSSQPDLLSCKKGRWTPLLQVADKTSMIIDTNSLDI